MSMVTRVLSHNHAASFEIRGNARPTRILVDTEAFLRFHAGNSFTRRYFEF